MRGMLEDESTAKRNAAMKQLQQDNLRLAQEKRDRENAWKNGQQTQNKAELNSTINQTVMTGTFMKSSGEGDARACLPTNYKHYTEGKKC